MSKDNQLTARQEALELIQANTAELASDLQHWKRSTKLPEGALYHRLASICACMTTIDDEYQIAELLLINHLIAQAAAAFESPPNG